jgi:hypothetical protein
MKLTLTLKSDDEVEHQRRHDDVVVNFHKAQLLETGCRPPQHLEYLSPSMKIDEEGLTC